jgi:hypothetical protein
VPNEYPDLDKILSYFLERKRFSNVRFYPRHASGILYCELYLAKSRCEKAWRGHTKSAGLAPASFHLLTPFLKGYSEGKEYLQQKLDYLISVLG